MKKTILTTALIFASLSGFGQVYNPGGTVTDSISAFTGDKIFIKDSLDMGNNKITNLGTPTFEDEAVNLKYLNGRVIDQLETIAELEAYTGESTTVIVKDSLRGGLFTYVPSGLVANHGTIFDAANGGFWVRQYDGVNITPEWFGALGDGVNNDSQAFQYITQFMSGVTVHGSPNATYRLEERIPLTSNMTWDGNGATISAHNPTPYIQEPLFGVQPNNVVNGGTSNVHFLNWKFINNYIPGGDGSFRRCIQFVDNSYNNSVKYCEFTDFYWNVSYTAGTGAPDVLPDGSESLGSGLEIMYNKVHSTLSVSFFIYKGFQNLNISHNIIMDSGKEETFGFAILIDALSSSETTSADGRIIKNGVVSNNYIDGWYENGINVSGGTNITIENNYLTNGGYINGILTSGLGRAIIVGKAGDSGLESVDVDIRNNTISEVKGSALGLSGTRVSVYNNYIYDASLNSTDIYVYLGSNGDLWVDSEFIGNTIERNNGANVNTIRIRGAGSGQNCVIANTTYIGIVNTAVRFLDFSNGAVREPTLRVVARHSKIGTTSNRPDKEVTFEGSFYDQTINNAIWWDGSQWVNALGEIPGTNYSKVQMTEVTLTPTELQNIGTTSVELIPTAGNGKIIVVERVVAKMEAQTTAYDFTNGLQMVYDTYDDAIAVFDNTFANSILDAYSTVAGGSVPAYTNAGIFIESASNPTVGDGILHLKIYYRIVEF